MYNGERNLVGYKLVMSKSEIGYGWLQRFILKYIVGDFSISGKNTFSSGNSEKVDIYIRPSENEICVFGEYWIPNISQFDGSYVQALKEE